MSSVFISYSRQDQAFVQRLQQALEAQGREAWVDWQGIAPTAEWMAEIRRAIDAADAALYVVSPAWVASAVCAQELAHAVQQGKRLVPVVCRDVPAASVPEALARLNWVMLREHDDFDEGVKRLLAGLDVDQDWVRDHTRLVVRAQEWQSAGQDDASLLRGRELDEAEAWLAAGATHTDPAPVALQVAYITSSRAAARRRQRLTRGLVLSALGVAIALAVWALIERDSAIENADRAIAEEKRAVANEQRAVEQEGIAKAQTLVAQQQTQAAETARDAERRQREAAQAAQREAERQRDEAERQRIAAQARQLAARAEAQPAADPALLQRSALLAAESLRLLPNLDGDQVLRRAIARLPPQRAALPHAGIIDTDAVHGDGSFLALVEAPGTLRVIDIGRMRETFRFDAGGRVRHVHVDRAGRYVVLTSARDGTLLVFTNGNPPRRIDGCSAVGAAFGGPAATWLALGCGRGVRLIDAADPAVPERRLEGSEDQLALAFDGGSDRLAGVDSRGDVRVWNVADGGLLARVQGQDSSTTSWSKCCTAFIGWSANGDHIAANNLADHRLHVIDTRAWKTHARLRHESTVNVFAFDGYGKLLASGDDRGRITVWDVADGSIVARMAHQAEITHLELHARSLGGDREPELLSASTDRTARVWNPFTGAELARASQPTSVIRVTRPWEPHFGGRFVSVDGYTGIAQWDMRPMTAPLPLPGPRDRRTSTLHCSEPGGQRHWFTGAARLLGWDAERPGVPRDGLFYGGQPAQPVALDRACRWMALATGGELRIVDPAAVRSGAAGSVDRPLHTEALGPGGRDGWWLSPRGTLLALRDRQAGDRLWRTTDWARLDTGPGCKVLGIVPSPAEKQVALDCGNDLRVLDVAAGTQAARLALPAPVALTDDGRLVLQEADQITVRRLPAGAVLARAAVPPALKRAAVAVDDGGRWLALAGGNALGLWRLSTLQPRALLEREPVASPAGPRRNFDGGLQFSPDGAHLLVHGFDRLFVFDTEPWAARAELIHPGEAGLVRWDLPTRRLLAQVTYRAEDREAEYSVRGWSIDGGAELLRVPLARAARSVAVSGDGRFLLAEQLHRLSADALREAACRLVSRNLTRREWQAEFGGRPYQRTCAHLPEPPPGTPSWDQ